MSDDRLFRPEIYLEEARDVAREITHGSSESERWRMAALTLVKVGAAIVAELENIRVAIYALRDHKS